MPLLVSNEDTYIALDPYRARPIWPARQGVARDRSSGPSHYIGPQLPRTVRKPRAHSRGVKRLVVRS
jgi:hypothetical protein